MADTGRASGIAAPFGSTPFGGLMLASGDDLIAQYVATFAADCDSDNPFQDLGIGQDAVFQIKDDTAWKAQAAKRVEDAFTTYLGPSNLAVLDKIEFSDGADGLMYMDVWFISIESNERLNVRQPVNRSY